MEKANLSQLTTTLSYQEFQDQVKILPDFWYPSVLRILVGEIIKRKIFVDFGTTQFVQKIEAELQTPSQLKIHYSKDQYLYYISREGGELPKSWLSVGKFETNANQILYSNNFFVQGYFEFDSKGPNPYFRKVFPFSFYEVQSGETKPIERDSELWKDYAAYMDWVLSP